MGQDRGWAVCPLDATPARTPCLGAEIERPRAYRRVRVRTMPGESRWWMRAVVPPAGIATGLGIVLLWPGARSWHG